MIHLEKLEKIQKLNKKYIWQLLHYPNNSGRTMLNRYRHSKLKDNFLIGRFEKAIDTVYEFQLISPLIQGMEAQSNGVVVQKDDNGTTKVIFITYVDLMEFKIKFHNDHFANDVEYMRSNAREEILKFESTNPGGYKVLICAFLSQNIA